MKPYHDKSILENHYINENKTCKEIAKIYGVTHTVIWDWVKKFNIPTRSNHTRKGLPDTEKQKEGRKKTGDKLKGRVFSEETLNKMRLSKIGNKNYNYGKKRNVHGKRVWYTCPNGEIVSMRSNWEACYADWLTQNFIEWKYEPNTFQLANGSAYTPDFFLPEENKYIEVKGWLHDKHKAKMDSFRIDYPDIELVLANKEYLKNINCNLNVEHPSNKPNLDKNCPICEQTFKPKVKQQIYCSVLCRNRYISTLSKQPKQLKQIKSKRLGNYKQSGANNNSSKLTEDKVLEIIKLRKAGSTIKDIVNKTNASTSNIYNILKGRSWKHLGSFLFDN